MKVKIPTHCPSCNSILTRINDQLFCQNPHCGGKLEKQVKNYAKVLKIKGLGEKTIEKLGIRTIPDIYNISLDAAKAAIGEKLAAKLISEIEKSKVVTLDKFIAACSIPLIGETAGRKLLAVATDPSELDENKCRKAGLGTKAISNLLEWLNTDYVETLKDLPLTFKKVEKPQDTYNKVVCITGKIPGYTKAKLADFLSTKYSVQVVDNVSKKVDYLICAERKNSAKEKKATELGIKIVTLDEFIKEIS